MSYHHKFPVYNRQPQTRKNDKGDPKIPLQNTLEPILLKVEPQACHGLGSDWKLEWAADASGNFLVALDHIT